MFVFGQLVQMLCVYQNMCTTDIPPPKVPGMNSLFLQVEQGFYMLSL